MFCLQKKKLLSIKRISSLLLLLFSTHAFPQTITDKVIAIADGDTLTVLQNKNQYKIRLAEIDTPEKGQPYGTKAKQALSEMVFGKIVTVQVTTTDRYGRYIGEIYYGSIYVNSEMVRKGHAWVYRKYSKDEPCLN